MIVPYKQHFLNANTIHRSAISHGKNSNNNVEFSEYFDLYEKERSKYPIIANNVLMYETQFKSILSYEIIINNDLSDSDKLYSYLESIHTKLNNSTRFTSSRIQHIVQQITDLENNIEKYDNIYFFFVHISLGTALTIYIGLPHNLQDQIFSGFKQSDMTFGVNKISDFIGKVFMLVSIRNCVIHCNSLELLIQYYDVKTQTLRKQRSKKNFVKMINYLSKEKQYTY